MAAVYSVWEVYFVDLKTSDPTTIRTAPIRASSAEEAARLASHWHGCVIHGVMSEDAEKSIGGH